MRYFAYGSNMSSRRLRVRVPTAIALGVAELPCHRLRFHKPGRLDGTAKCDAEETGDAQDRVFGVLFEIDPKHWPLLDRAEGLGCGYERRSVRLRMHGSSPEAFTYYATIRDATLKPLCWYRQHVLEGAREHGLPADYIEAVRRVQCIADADAERAQAELAIYI